MTTRQLNRLFHEAANGAGIKKGVTLHALRHYLPRLIMSNEASPQTDEACCRGWAAACFAGLRRSLVRERVPRSEDRHLFCGPDRRFMRSSGKTGLDGTDGRSKRLQAGKTEQPEPPR